MKSNSILRLLLAVIAVLALASCATTFADPKDPLAVGILETTAATGGSEIIIQPDTKWVNVNQYEIVKFVVPATGKNFTWNFGTRSFAVVDMSVVAPAGSFPPGQQVIAYVSAMTRGAEDGRN